TEVLPLEEAKKKGALAFFAEKYGATVRVVSIGNYSTEFCGGTHVATTADIQSVKVVSEGSVAQGIRRIEAVAGNAAVGEFLKQRQSDAKLKEETQKLKELEKQKQDARFEEVKASVDNMIAAAVEAKGVKFLSQVLTDMDAGSLRKLSDLLRQKL